ncbi:MAG TPA: hypothetical protein VFO69_06810 [Allosphingosinicella sp.]|nr:hypothetical protein [Allosphingosinicella sp.]
MEPPAADDEQFARFLIFSNDDGTAPIRAILLFERVQGLLFREGQPDMAAKPLS